MTTRPFRNTLSFAAFLLCSCGSDTDPGAPAPPTATSDSAGAGQAAGGAPSTGPTSPAAGSGGSGAPATMSSATGTAGAQAAGTTGASAAGAAGTSTPPTAAGAGGATPSMNTAGAPAAGASGAAAPAGMEPAAQTGTLPTPDALDKLGPFEIVDQDMTGPGKAFRLFAPKPMAGDGRKYPIVAWSPGAGAFPDAYLSFLNTLASQGFVTLSFNSTAQGPDLVNAIDWLIAENDRADSMLYHKLDTQKIAAGGHSAGSLATYQMADDPRLATTLHMSGGSFMPATDVPKLKKPALMVCGDSGGDGLTTGDLANPMCLADFQMAKVPVFFAVVKGAGHTALNDAAATANIGTAPDDPKKLLMIKAAVGWLRWQLAGDETMKKLFVGNDCELCAPDSGYVVQQRDLN